MVNENNFLFQGLNKIEANAADVAAAITVAAMKELVAAASFLESSSSSAHISSKWHSIESLK